MRVYHHQHQPKNTRTRTRQYSNVDPVEIMDDPEKTDTKPQARAKGVHILKKEARDQE